MIRTRWIALMMMSLVVAMLVAACGNSSGGGAYGTGSSTQAQSGTTPTAVSTSGNGSGCYRYCATPTAPTGNGNANASIQTATITLNGKSETVLVNGQGFVLYYRTSDTSSSVCSGGCASTWPPVMSKTAPASTSTMPGKFSTVNDANGSQLAYEGHPLYTYTGDTSAGQSTGECIGNVWYVVLANFSQESSLACGSSGYGY